MADDPTTPEWHDTRFDPYILAVGRITTLWASLEWELNQTIWELANIELGAGACITSQIFTVSSRMRCIIALVHYRHGSNDLLGDLEKFMRKVEGLSRQRNRYIHDPSEAKMVEPTCKCDRR
jgi:hypothetical protein